LYGGQLDLGGKIMNFYLFANWILFCDELGEFASLFFAWSAVDASSVSEETSGNDWRRFQQCLKRFLQCKE
jgi:hypothetical protein